MASNFNNFFYKDRLEMNELKDKNEQYNQYLYKHKPNQSKGGFGRIITGLLLTVIVIIAAAFAFIGYAGTDNKYSKMLMSFVKDLSPKQQKGFNLPILQQKQNILIVGVDSNGKNADPFAHGYNGVRRPRVLRTLCSDVKALYPCDNIRRIDAPDNISAQHAQQFFHGLHLSNVLSRTFYHVHDGMSRCP